jgi:beta-ketoacyl-acyl-carrier-protein synthase II
MTVSEHRVVVTGMGMVSPVGLSAPETWEAIVKGTNGIAPITLFDPDGQEVTFAAEVKGFDPARYMDRKEVRRNDRFVQFAVASSLEAVEHAGLHINGANGTNAEDVGVIMGSGIGGITTLTEQMQVLMEKGARRVSPFLVPMMIVDMASGAVSIRLGAKGPNFVTVSACATGADAIGVSYDLIRLGQAKAMVCGGTEAAITPIGIAGFASARALSTRNDDPAHASRPFDKDRDGFVMGEGAATLVIESLEHARARGASILAELVAYAATADAHHITQPAEGGEGGVRAMRLALQRASLRPEDIDYINAHGTSTPMNDEFETQAIKTVFGEQAYKVPISSTKSMIGHLLGAAGAIEAAFCVMAIQEGVIPPTINYATPDPACDLDYTPNAAREAEISVALTNSLGFGGHNATLIFKRFEE